MTWTNKYADSQKRINNPTNGFYNGSVYFQDVYAAWKNFELIQNPISVGPFQIGGVLNYVYTDGCYIMNFAVAVKGEWKNWFYKIL